MNGAIHAARFAGSFARALIPSAYALGYCMPPASRAGAAVLSRVEDWGRASTGPRLSPKVPDRSRPTALFIDEAALPVAAATCAERLCLFETLSAGSRLCRPAGRDAERLCLSEALCLPVCGSAALLFCWFAAVPPCCAERLCLSETPCLPFTRGYASCSRFQETIPAST